MVGCDCRAEQYLTPFSISDGLNGFPTTERANNAGYFATRRVLLHRCGLINSGTFQCPSTSGQTSCCALTAPMSRGYRGHTNFHGGNWQLFGNLLHSFWSAAYCKAHATWLTRFACVLEHLLKHSKLPLDGSTKGLSRWLRTQLTTCRKLRFRFRSKLNLRSRVLLPSQVQLLKTLPGWSSTGHWLHRSAKMMLGQKGKRMLQIERRHMETFLLENIKRMLNL